MGKKQGKSKSNKENASAPAVAHVKKQKLQREFIINLLKSGLPDKDRFSELEGN